MEQEELRRASTLIGWQEWCALPELGLGAIKAKIDTGARTSALHAFKVEPFETSQGKFVRFWLHPLQRRHDVERICEAPLIDQRLVTDSGGHQELRYVIKTKLQLGKDSWEIEITLTDRDSMSFRMLLGRKAMLHRLTVDPSKSFMLGKLSSAKAKKLFYTSLT